MTTHNVPEGAEVKLALDKPSVHSDTSEATNPLNVVGKLRTIYERAYDNPKAEDGSDKPNKLLGTYKVVQVLSDDMYAEKFIGENKHGRFLITEYEVSGYYSPGLGGSRYEVERLGSASTDEVANT